MSRVEVKRKLRGIIQCMLLSDSEADLEIPDAIAQQMLQNYGCTVGDKSDEKEDLNPFLEKLQKWVENNHPMEETDVQTKEDVDFDLNLYEKYLQAETEYNEVASELATVLEEAVKYKETYSEYFKNECHSLETSVDVLSKKCQLLKQQIFLKLYGEENALRAHLALRQKLREELDSLRRKHNELLEYNQKMNEIKNNKTFCELFKVYKELRQIEQRTEILGTL